ncbi:N-acetylneuraminate synthase family protein [Alphaproteobacteria bacterium]|nr:N-acetylneuraminate synthase family protein [Alphaproteobacteria bacterium]
MKVEIIAEIAQGFEGSREQAKLLALAAAKAGADAAKFQLIYANELATPDYKYFDLFKNLEMSDDDWLEIKKTCDSNHIELIFDVFGELSVGLAEKLNIKTIKLHATDINNVGFLNRLSKSSIERVMLGAGGAFEKEIKNAIRILTDKNVILFHGFQGYPTKMQENQIDRINFWKTSFGKYKNVQFGFSDHVDPESPSNITLPAFAVGQGALFLEKHITLGACMELEDHESALNPDQFKIFVSSIKDICDAYGTSFNSNDFGMSESEHMYRKKIRRHVVLQEDIKLGEVIEADNVVLKRTSNENALTDLQEVYGKKVIKDISKNSPIIREDLY